MKVLSIRQPYAFAVAMGAKPVENRDWPTRYRGPVLIHAGQREERGEVEGVIYDIARALKTAESAVALAYRAKASRGAIVGAAVVTDCVTDHPSDWFFGRYGFLMERAALFDLPIPLKGALGFFAPPAEVLQQPQVLAWLRGLPHA